MKKTTEMHVKDFVRHAHTIRKDLTIGEALNHMNEKGIEFLSVVDESHKLIGCVNDQSFMHLIKQTPSAMSDPVWYDTISPEVSSQPVESIMTAGISTISPEENIDTAFKIMDSVGYKLLHVIDGEGKLMGVITLRDVIHKMLGA